MPTGDAVSPGTATGRTFPAYKPPRQPFVGAVVHYVASSTEDGKGPPVCRAAFVTEVAEADPYLLGVCAFWPVGLFGVPLSAGGVPANFVDHEDAGSWHWPTPADPDTSPPRDWMPQ